MKSVDQVIVHHVITEKSTDLQGSHKYTFLVRPEATKFDIRRAVESLFSVNVLAVQTLPVRPHRKGGSRTPGYTSKGKKAIVQIKSGQKISVLEVKA